MKALKGLSLVLKNLNNEIAKVRLHTKEGLTEAALVVKADSVRETPVDLANLRGSAFIMVTGKNTDNKSPSFKGKGASKLGSGHSRSLVAARQLVGSDNKRLKALIGYSANYALWVHEMPSSYNFNQGANKFLLKSLLKNKERVNKIIRKWARVR